jgi:predicted acylesterase/phospholipase RssA
MSQPGERQAEPFALTISGGVSLGAYEAGLSWALVHYFQQIQKEAHSDSSLRHPELVAVTGASAGSINALLVALSWCARESPSEDIDHNLFLSTWLPVGFDTLLPPSQENTTAEGGYAPSDGLLTRSAFREAIGAIEQRLESGNGYRFPCRVPLGITVTRAVPETVEEAGLRTPRQRFSLPWMLEIEPDGRPVIRNDFLTGEGARNALMYLTPWRGTELRTSLLLSSIEASSAFPFAFGPVRLSYCAASCSSSGHPGTPVRTDPACEAIAEGLQRTVPAGVRLPPLQVCTQDFFDGGVFDNTPVGTALLQAEQFLDARGSGSNPIRPLTYLFVDPDFRRLQPAPEAEPQEVPDISKQVGFISNAVSTARGFELYNAIQNKGWNLTLLRHARHTADALSRLSEYLEPPWEQPPEEGSVAPTGAARGGYGRLLAACLEKVSTGAAPETCAHVLDTASPGDAPPLTFRELSDLATHVRAMLLNTPLTCQEGVLSVSKGGRPLLARRLRLAALAQGFLAEELNRSDYGRAPPGELATLRERLLGITATLRGLLPCAQGEELPVLLREADALGTQARDRSMRVSSRFSPLASSQLRNFGAFLDEPLRRTDYYIGVYEAAHQLAEYFCTEQDPYNRVVWRDQEASEAGGAERLLSEVMQRCLGEKLEFVATKLHVASSAPASHVFRTLASLEVRASLEPDASERVLASPEWRWLAALPLIQERTPSEDARAVAQVLEVLTSKSADCQGSAARGRCLGDVSLTELSQGLARTGYTPRSDTMRLFLRDSTRWVLETAMRSASRASVIQSQTPMGEGLEPVLNAARLLMNRQVGLREALHVNASSVPLLRPPPPGTWRGTPWLFSLVPYRVAIDVAHRGLMLSWFEPVWRPTNRLTGRLGLNPLEVRWNPVLEPRVSSSVTPSFAFGVSSLVSLGGGPTLEARWWEKGREQWALGGELYADFLQERLRIGVALRDTPGTQWTGLLYLGFADVNGTLFWMTR